MIPPMPMAFFPPPPFLNLPPPPMPPPNFTGLTEAELRAMEGQERSNVEARIKVLRNIQVLLDAAVMEMNQYTAVVSRLSTAAPAAPAASSATAPEPSPAAEVVTNAATEPVAEVATSSQSTSAPVQTGTRPKASSRGASEPEPEEEELIRTMDQEDQSGELTDEQTELRRRRLEKFEKKDDGGGDTTPPQE